MIHTFKIYFPLDYRGVQDIQHRLGIKYTELNGYLEGLFSGISVVLMSKDKGEWHLSMFVDVIKLLNTPNIREDMYIDVEYKVKKFFGIFSDIPYAINIMC
ncbi:hypothetical protein [Radiobacillus deserti]|uniref:hypothetical protein n=1 Tax=Radiobacillus deserti TaxID=2594883 RepID=UPI001E59EEC4|nr:hypothetical protein [Radiobacillus deserti]